MRRALPLLAALLLSALAAPAAERSPLERAMDAFTAGDMKKVEEICSGIDEKSPDHLRALYLRGEARLMVDRPKDAEADFRAVVEAKPDAVPALTGLGRALLAENRAEDALTPLERATKKDPKDPKAWCARGRALAAVGKGEEAEKAFRRAHELDASDPLIGRAYVEFLVAADRTKPARAIADSVVRKNPKAAMGYFLVGYVLDRDGKSEEAIAMYEKALERDENFIDAHKNIAILYHTINPTYQDVERTKKAFQHYQRYFELGGKDETLRRIYLQTKGYLEQLGLLKKK